MTAEEIFNKAQRRIGELDALAMSLDNWCEACDLIARTLKVACISKVEDVSVRRFYLDGLKYLSRPPKELTIEAAFETLDDSNEFYSYDDELRILEAFTPLMDQLEEWAEIKDLQHDSYWRSRETTKQWEKANWDDDYYDKPPYYAWVLVTVNRVKRRFQPPGEEYDNAVNTNPYHQKLFAYQGTRQEWRFRPAIIETLLSRVTEAESQSPLVEKYLAWGASSPDEIPSWCLTIKDGLICKEIFEKNLTVRAADSVDLLRILNQNVKEYFAARRQRVRKLVDECFCGAIYQEKSPVQALQDKLDEILDGVSRRYLQCDGCNWWSLLAESLRLPRYTLVYHYWGDPEEGPTEPGLFFKVADGSKCEVFYDTQDSEWHNELDCVEHSVEELIRRCMGIAIESEMDALVNEWLEIKANWDLCRDSDETNAHCVGDPEKFSISFCRGVVKIGGILPLLKQKREAAGERKPRSAEEAVKLTDAKYMEQYKARRKQIQDVFTRQALLLSFAGNPFSVVHKKLIDELALLKDGAPAGPVESACWQEVLKLILTYRAEYDEFESVSREDEWHIEMEGANGEKYYLYGHTRPSQEDADCREIVRLVGDYIGTGEMRSRICKSRSHDDWMQALAVWKRCKHALRMANTQMQVNRMVDFMIKAAELLSVDYNINCGEHDADVTSDKIADAVMDRVQPQFDSVKKTGKSILEKEEHILHVASSGEYGKPPKDGRNMPEMRETMVEDGFLLVRDAGCANLSDVARKIVRKYAGRPGVYSENETDTLRRAIARKCKDEGLNVKATQDNE